MEVSCLVILQGQYVSKLMPVCQVHKDSLWDRGKQSSFVSRPHISVSHHEIQALDSSPVMMALLFIYSFFLLWAYSLISALGRRNFERLQPEPVIPCLISKGWKQSRAAAVRLDSSFSPCQPHCEQP